MTKSLGESPPTAYQICHQCGGLTPNRAGLKWVSGDGTIAIYDEPTFQRLGKVYDLYPVKEVKAALGTDLYHTRQREQPFKIPVYHIPDYKGVSFEKARFEAIREAVRMTSRQRGGEKSARGRVNYWVPRNAESQSALFITVGTSPRQRVVYALAPMIKEY